MRRSVVAAALIVGSIVIYGGCGNGIYGIVARDQGDPDTFYLNVDSFSEENVIRCSWAKDER